jgi:hypothetical protein
MTNSYTILVGKPEGNKALGRPRRGCEDNIKTDLIPVEMACEDED